MMNARLNYAEIANNALKAMVELEKYVFSSGLNVSFTSCLKPGHPNKRMRLSQRIYSLITIEIFTFEGYEVKFTSTIFFDYNYNL